MKIKFILHQNEKNTAHLLLAYKWHFLMSLGLQNHLHFAVMRAHGINF